MSANWYYTKNKDREGPVTPAQLKQLASKGWLAPDDLVWKEGMPNWLPARKVRGLFESRLVQQLTGTVDGVVVRDAGATATQPQQTLVVPAGTPDGGFAQPAAASVVVINQAPVRRWSPGLAAVLSFFLPGLGHLYKGQIINAVVWFFFLGVGYMALILPGLVLHFFCVLGALTGNPWTEPKTTVVRQ